MTPASSTAGVIREIRAGTLQIREDRAAYRIAMDEALSRYSPETAAVELINILRPTVAVGRFITFGLLPCIIFPTIGNNSARSGFRLPPSTITI